jgi:hypothetical protein
MDESQKKKRAIRRIILCVEPAPCRLRYRKLINQVVHHADQAQAAFEALRGEITAWTADYWPYTWSTEGFDFVEISQRLFRWEEVEDLCKELKIPYEIIS